jgi:putative hydrolase
MQILVDTHTHTLMSGHAFSTVEENALACARHGLEGFAVTDHGPAMQGAAQAIYFYCLDHLPRQLHGVGVLRGVEANIVDFSGKLDLPAAILKKLDVCIASFHDIILRPQTAAEHTAAWLAVVQNPHVDILGHPGRGDFPFDIEVVVQACRANGKIVEINNHSLKGGHDESCRRIAAACAQYGVPVVVSSDAHISVNIGQVHQALALLSEIGFPEELVVNQTFERFRSLLAGKKPWLADL